jgi:hypothetical protein
MKPPQEPKQERQELTEEDRTTLARKAGDTALGGLSAAGNLLDLVGSSVRDLATWAPGGIEARNPFDQWLTPFSGDNRTTEAELLQSAGLMSDREPTSLSGKVGRFGAEVGFGAAIDPTSYFGIGLFGRALGGVGKVVKKAGLLDRSMEIAGAGKRVSSMTTTLRDVIQHGGPTWEKKLRAANKGVPFSERELNEPLGGLFNFGLPGGKDIPLGTGDTAQKIAAKLDAAGEAVRFGQYSPVRYLAPLFSKPTLGTQSGEGQRAAIALSDDKEEALRFARERMYEPIKRLQEAEVLKGPDAFDNHINMLEYLEDIEPDKPLALKPFQDAYDADIVNIRTNIANEMVQVTQGVPEAQWTRKQAVQVGQLEKRMKRELKDAKKNRDAMFAANGFDWKPKLTPATEPLRPVLDDLKKVMEEAIELELDAGVAITELNDPITYFARLRQTDQGPMRKARDRNSFAPTDAFALGRDKSMRGMLKGTAMLQKMSIDQEFAGIARMKGWNKDTRIEARNRWRQKYGLVQQNTMFDGEEWQRNTDRLFDKISKLDRKQVERGVPMFATNPAEVALRRLESSVKAASSAYGVRRFLNSYAQVTAEAADETDELVDLGTIFGNAQKSSINQGHRAAKDKMLDELGETSQMAVYGIFERKKPAMIESMIDAQLSASGVNAAGMDMQQKTQRVLDDWFQQTGDRYDNIDDFLGPDWEDDAIKNMAISTDDILREIKVPKRIAEDASRVINAFSSPQEMSKLVAAYDAFTDWFKTNVTATAPGFHIRNFLSSLIQGIVGGAHSPTSAIFDYNDGQRAMRGKEVKGIAKWLTDDSGNLAKSDVDGTEQLQREIFSQGVLESPGGHNDLVGNYGGRVAEQIPGVVPIRDQFKAPQGTKWHERINPLATAGTMGETDRFFAARWGRGVGNQIEGLVRTSAYIGLRKQGYNATEAAKRVKELFVDYSNLSDSERKVMRRVFPFYAFTKGASTMIAKELATNPGGRLSHTIQSVNTLRGENVTTPDYVSDTTSISLGEQLDGSDRYITGFGLMHEAPLGLLPTKGLQGFGLDLLSQMNPLPKSILEYSTGQSFFQQGPDGGRPLRDTDPLLGRIVSNVREGVTGEKEFTAQPLPRWLEVAAANSPASRYLSMTRTLTDTRKDAGTKATNLLTGVRVQDVSPAAREAILRERSEEILQNMGAKQFVQTYIPDYVKANMSPEQLEKVEQWEAMKKWLDDSAKRRKRELAETP